MRRILVLFAVLVLCLTSAAPAAAAPPVNVFIEGDMHFGGLHRFIAYGPAVDAGLMCPAGDIHELRNIAAGPPWFSRQVFHVWHEFECDDGSGSFTLNLAARLVFEPYSNNGNWNVLKGTGAYASLHGAGRQVGYPTPGGVLDVYTGWVFVP